MPSVLSDHVVVKKLKVRRYVGWCKRCRKKLCMYNLGEFCFVCSNKLQLDWTEFIEAMEKLCSSFKKT